jgi:hypothetical protein
MDVLVASDAVMLAARFVKTGKSVRMLWLTHPSTQATMHKAIDGIRSLVCDARDLTSLHTSS